MRIKKIVLCCTLTICLISVNAAEKRKEKGVDDLIKELTSKSYKVRMKAAAKLGYKNVKKAVPFLIERLMDKNEHDEVRCESADALGFIGGEKARDILITTLYDNSSSVRIVSARSLGNIADKKALNPMKKALKMEKNEYVKNVIALGILKISNDNDALNYILDVLYDPLRKISIYNIREIELWQKVIPKTADAIAESLKSNSPHSHAYRKVFLKIGKPSVEALIAILKAEDPFIREEAAKTLGQIKDKRAVLPLIELLEDKQWKNERSCLVDTLGQIGNKQAVPVLLKLIDNEKLKYSSSVALGRIGDKRAIEPLKRIFTKEPSDSIKPGVAFGLFKLTKDKEAFEYLIAALGKGNALAAYLLGEIGDKRAIKPLIQSLKSKGYKVVSSAGNALDKITKENMGDNAYETWNKWYEENKDKIEQGTTDLTP